MRCLKKPKFDVATIVKDCANSFRGEKKELFSTNALYIKEKSDAYDSYARMKEWEKIPKEDKVNGVISAKDMNTLYSEKFAKHMPERGAYYDKIMSLAVNGKCPICGIGQVSTLDHYLAKSLYPTYAVTPVNLIPTCKDCNHTKLDYEITSIESALFHPYYDNIDNVEWLCARVEKKETTIVAQYYVNPNLENNNLYLRLKNHFDTYKLGKAYAIQASTEIAENTMIWKRKYNEGKTELKSLLEECLKSRENYMKNTWNTALLRALIKNIEVFSDI